MIYIDNKVKTICYHIKSEIEKECSTTQTRPKLYFTLPRNNWTAMSIEYVESFYISFEKRNYIPFVNLMPRTFFFLENTFRRHFYFYLSFLIRQLFKTFKKSFNTKNSRLVYEAVNQKLKWLCGWLLNIFNTADQFQEGIWWRTIRYCIINLPWCLMFSVIRFHLLVITDQKYHS